MKKYFISLLLLGLLTGQPVFAQNKISAGVELDVLPYLTGGYFGAVWLGKGNVRGRALYASVNMPDFIVEEGFTNNQIKSFAVLGDYFFKSNWKGLWLGAGLVYWKGNIQSDQMIEKVNYESYLVNGSMGYNLWLGKHFYLSPWAGLSLRVEGDRNIEVDGSIYEPPALNPELSLKLGYQF